MLYPSFETERLILKPSTEEDAPFFLALLNSPSWIKYIGDRNIKTIQAAKDYINFKVRPSFDQHGFGNYTVILKSNKEKIGSCGLYDREGLEGIDIGFAFLPAYFKKGYGFESASKVLELSIHEFGQTDVKAITSKINIGSQRLLEKIGLIFDRYIHLPNDPEELMLYQYPQKLK